MLPPYYNNHGLLQQQPSDLSQNSHISSSLTAASHINLTSSQQQSSEAITNSNNINSNTNSRLSGIDPGRDQYMFKYQY